MTSRDMVPPEWRKVSTGQSAKSHLRDANRFGMVAWCGADLTSSYEGPYDRRCRPCVQAAAHWMQTALLEPPKALTNTYLLTVTRPSTAEDPLRTLERKLKSNTTWTWKVEEHPSCIAVVPHEESE